MTAYTVALFFHIIGAIGYFLSIGTWLIILVGLRRARRVAEVRALMRLNDFSGPFGAACAMVLLLAGLYLAVSAWSLLTGWILVALVVLILMIPAVAALIAPRRSALVKQLAREAPDGSLSDALKQRIHDPVLATTVQTVAALLVGFVFLMTTKPTLVGAVIVMVVALVLGLIASMLSMLRERALQPELATSTTRDEASAG